MRAGAALGTLGAALLAAAIVACTAGTGRDGADGEEGEPLRVLSFNIRYDNPDDGPNAWPNRRDWVVALIRERAPDVLGLQEALWGQVRDLEAGLPGWARVGVGRDDGARGGELSPIFYRTDRLELIEDGTFWLSPTPEEPGSRGWDADHPRIVTRALLRERRSGRPLHVFNTHFDHAGERARLESARMLAERVAGLPPGEPVILLGDLNAEPEAAPLRLLEACGERGDPCLRDAREIAEAPAEGPEGTFHGFATGAGPGRRIDYVLVRGLRVLRMSHVAETRNGAYPSDHIPAFAELSFSGPGKPAASGREGGG